MKKAGICRPFSSCLGERLDRGNGGNWTGIHTCAAINAGIRINNPFLACFAYSVGRAGIITCAAINAFIGNNVRQGITSFKKFLIRKLIICIHLIQIIICISKNPAQKKELDFRIPSWHQKGKQLLF
jgi:hypothetical protein